MEAPSQLSELGYWTGACLAISTVVLYFIWVCKVNKWYVGPLDLVPGIPFVGHAISIGIRGGDFIRQCHIKYGDIFTLDLAGKKTFLFEESALAYFFTAPEDQLAFRPAVEQFTQRVFGLPSEHFFPQHETMLRTLRSLLGPDDLPHLARSLLDHMEPLLPAHPEHTIQADLSKVVCDLLFGAATGTLFGDQFLNRHGRANLQEAFQIFESGFELAASPVPHLFQPGFCRARRFLVNALRASLRAGDLEGTVVGRLLGSCSLAEKYAPNMLLAVLWASLANTLPASIWCTAFLLLPDQATWREAVMTSLQPEIASVISAQKGQRADEGGRCPADGNDEYHAGGHGGFHADALIQAALDPAGPLAKVVAETIRLRAPGIDVRMAVADTALPSSSACPVIIPQGRVVAISPYESHMDPRLFWPRPEIFDPGRPGISTVTQPSHGPSPLSAARTSPSACPSASRAGSTWTHMAAAVFTGEERGSAHLAPESGLSANGGPQFGSAGEREEEGGKASPHMIATAPHANRGPTEERGGDEVRLHVCAMVQGRGPGKPVGLGSVPGVHGVAGLSFGGGRYRCPGRRFAEMEVALVAAVLLSRYHMELASTLPEAAMSATPASARGPAASSTTCRESASLSARTHQDAGAHIPDLKQTAAARLDGDDKVLRSVDNSEQNSGMRRGVAVKHDTLATSLTSEVGPMQCGGSSHGCKGCVSLEREGYYGRELGTNKQHGWPGDPMGLLPAPETRRQVGIRWPRGPCVVHMTQRTSRGTPQHVSSRTVAEA